MKKTKLLLIVFALVKLRYTFGSLHVTYNVTNKDFGTDLYKCARSVTSNLYIGAKYKLKRYGVCEPLEFRFAASGIDDDHVYLLKTCVKEYFPEKKLGEVDWMTPVLLEHGTKITVKFETLTSYLTSGGLSFNIGNEMYTVFHMRTRLSNMNTVIFNRRISSIWGQEVNQRLRNPIQVGKEYTLRLEIQGNIIKTYINDEFIHDFQYDIPLSEGSWFKVKVQHSYTAAVQTSYIEMCKE